MAETNQGGTEVPDPQVGKPARTIKQASASDETLTLTLRNAQIVYPTGKLGKTGAALKRFGKVQAEVFARGVENALVIDLSDGRKITGMLVPDKSGLILDPGKMGRRVYGIKQQHSTAAYEGMAKLMRGLTATQAENLNAGDAYEPDDEALCMIDGKAMFEDDLRKHGGCFDLAQVRLLLGNIARQAVDQRVQKGSLIAVTGDGNKRVYPVFQFHNGRVLPGLSEVLAALPATHEWALVNFFVNADYCDDRSPVEMLRQSDIESALSAARDFADSGV
jgi:hypothetical protein